MVAGNIVLGWLQACSSSHRKRLAQRLGVASQAEGRLSLDGLAAALLAECAGDLDMKPAELASVVGNPRDIGREAVMELALTGLGAQSAVA